MRSIAVDNAGAGRNCGSCLLAGDGGLDRGGLAPAVAQDAGSARGDAQFLAHVLYFRRCAAPGRGVVRAPGILRCGCAAAESYSWYDFHDDQGERGASGPIESSGTGSG